MGRRSGGGGVFICARYDGGRGTASTPAAGADSQLLQHDEKLSSLLRIIIFGKMPAGVHLCRGKITTRFFVRDFLFESNQCVLRL
jgi:hypothetical protein